VGLTDETFTCPKCGLVIEGLTAKGAASAAETHEEFVHRLGLYIEAPVEPDTD
jgi:hypothetical protein